MGSYCEWIIKQLLNYLAFVGHGELNCRSRKVDNTFLDPQNSSYPTQPHPNLIYVTCVGGKPLCINEYRSCLPRYLVRHPMHWAMWILWARPLTKFMGADVLHTARISNVIKASCLWQTIWGWNFSGCLRFLDTPMKTDFLIVLEIKGPFSQKQTIQWVFSTS